LTLPARCFALAPVAYIGQKAAAVDETTDRRPGGRTLDRFIDPAPLEADSCMTFRVK